MDLYVDDHYKTYTKPLLLKASNGWKPSNKGEILQLLREVQIGYITLSTAAEILAR